MSWMQKLYETYEQCANAPQFVDAEPPLLPVCHVTQNAQIEIVLDEQGNFLPGRTQIIEKGDAQKTIIPCTEDSGGRAGQKPITHPLCDKLQYVAGDYLTFGGQVTSGFSKNPREPHQSYLSLLSQWVNSPYAHPKATAICEYVKRGQVIHDLVQEKILQLADDGKLLAVWNGEKKDTPKIFKAMPAGQTPENAFVRWRVETRGDPLSATWEDRDLMDAWIAFDASQNQDQGLCIVKGETALLARNHPKRLRNGGDGAKLISSNDTSGFTFLGRFTDARQACGIGFDVTQKAHNALRWLIGRQAYRNGDQVVVAWAVSGKSIPDPFANSHELFDIQIDLPEVASQVEGDVGQAFSKKLARLIAGYRADLGSTNEIVVMSLDSATPGRMAMTFYRELTGSEFLERVQAWHENVVWHQHYSNDLRFVGAPSPKDIAEAAFGRRLDDKLRKATVERLLPCIIDGQSIPRDLVESTIRRACNRAGLEHWEWEKNIGIACALFKGYFAERNYQMALEPDRTTRDYLYGRLLAIAEHIENRALYVARERRETSASRLMQRFADRPYSTWRTIELSLAPYKSRLRAKRPAFLSEMEKQIDVVIDAFQAKDFTDEKRLSGEFLLGYHCQRQTLWNKSEPDSDDEDTEN
ncbi:MAG: type I-C CRISPR-associated protein Cas8c/Csd1 [Candidatus Binatia bacterium]